MKSSQEISGRIWKLAAEFSHDPENSAATKEMVPALNSMIDVVTTRYMALQSKVPGSILMLLFILSLTCGFFGGYSSAQQKRPEWIGLIGFALFTSMVVFITLDLDQPRTGLINLDQAHKTIIELRQLVE
jgi:hypothetical protein